MTGEPQATNGAGVWRVFRVGLIVLCAVAALVAIGVGGAVSAQQVANARHVAVEAPIAYVSQQPPDAQPGASTQQAPTPTPVAKCGACSSVQKNAPVSMAPATCSGAWLPLPGATAPNPPSGVAIPSTGQFVLVSISKQWVWAYNNGQLYMASPVTTGMPGLNTPTGTFSIMSTEKSVWFYSPWPYGSPYYYTPEFIPYAMLFKSGGFYLHAAPWRHQFGPGTNVPHCNADGTWETGSHGCVNMPTAAAGELYNWIKIGTTVKIVY